MSLADNGGFDLVLEVDISAIDRTVRPLVNAPIPDQTFAISGWGTLRVHPVIALSSLALRPDGAIALTITTVGTTISWPDYRVAGTRIFAAGTASLSSTVSIAGTPEASGTALRLRFASDAAQVTITPGSLETIPAISAYLASVRLLHGNAAMESERANLYREFEQGMENGINNLLPGTLGLGTLPVSSVQIATTATAVRALMTIGGTPGNPAAITRSNIRRNASGVPIDLAAVVLSNTSLLRDILKPGLRAAFALPSSGFVGNTVHPCMWSGTKSFPAAATLGITPNITFLKAGVVGGQVRVDVNISGDHGTGAFGFTGSVRLGLGASVITTAGGGRAIRFSLTTSVVSSLDIHVAWWVYVGGIFVSPLLTLAIALTDAFAGGALAGGINAAVSGAVSAIPSTLPIPAGPLGPSVINLNQPDAAIRTITIAGITIPEFPMNDAIVSIGP